MFNILPSYRPVNHFFIVKSYKQLSIIAFLLTDYTKCYKIVAF